MTVIRVTEFERVASVTPTQLGQFHCPKCTTGVCNERSPEKRSPSKLRTPVREFDCGGCHRGWTQVPNWVSTVREAHAADEWIDATRPENIHSREAFTAWTKEQERGAPKPVVRFEYDETLRKWDPIVSGVPNETEARQAFNAVVLTCQTLEPALLDQTRIESVNFGESYRVIPAVRAF